MAMLLRRVWDSVLYSRWNSSSSSSETTPPLVYVHSSTGAFDQIPSDIFLQILKFLGPKEAARLSLVCRTWKLLVSDNRLWFLFLQNHQEPSAFWENYCFRREVFEIRLSSSVSLPSCFFPSTPLVARSPIAIATYHHHHIQTLHNTLFVFDPMPGHFIISLSPPNYLSCISMPSVHN